MVVYIRKIIRHHGTFDFDGVTSAVCRCPHRNDKTVSIKPMDEAEIHHIKRLTLSANDRSSLRLHRTPNQHNAQNAPFMDKYWDARNGRVAGNTIKMGGGWFNGRAFLFCYFGSHSPSNCFVGNNNSFLCILVQVSSHLAPTSRH